MRYRFLTLIALCAALAGGCDKRPAVTPTPAPETDPEPAAFTVTLYTFVNFAVIVTSSAAVKVYLLPVPSCLFSASNHPAKR